MLGQTFSPVDGALAPNRSNTHESGRRNSASIAAKASSTQKKAESSARGAASFQEMASAMTAGVRIDEQDRIINADASCSDQPDWSIDAAIS